MKFPSLRDIFNGLRNKPTQGGSAAPGQQCVVGTNYGPLGTVVSNPNIRPADFSSYAANRAATRGVTRDMIERTAANPRVVLQQSDGRFLFISDEAAVVLAPSGRIITTYPSQNYDPMIKSILGALP